MADETTTTRDVTELIHKTWTEGPLRLQVSTNFPVDEDIPHEIVLRDAHVAAE